jgi:uncharacterized protein involved in type VI secretion and phage assembly
VPDIDLQGLLSGRVGLVGAAAGDVRPRVDGVTLGVVTDVDDPLHLARVKVKLPWLSGQVESGWAQVASPWAGSRRGAYLVPEVDDQVVVAFRHGDVRHPIVLGCYWTASAPPPEADPRLERRGLTSKGGHALVLDDTPGAGKVTVTTAAGTTLTLDDTGAGQVTVGNRSGTVQIVLDLAQGAITLSTSTGNISLSAPAGKVSVQAAAFEVQSTGPLQLQSSATVSVKGALVQVN